MAARKGVFGRLPRQAPNLTASIVSLVRAAQAQTDQNYLDAWKNGGQVDGSGVSDSRLLAHLKDRRDQLSPDDPSWALWNNQYQQYDFAIEESKTNLKYDQKKMTDSQVAAFYKKWADKPASQADGEFYRHLMDQAAKFDASAKAGRAASGAKAKAEAHQNFVNNVVNTHGVQAAADMNNGILQIAIEMGAAPKNANSLSDVYFNSDAWGKVVDVINSGKADDPNVQGLVDAYTKVIQKHEPGFTWSQTNVNALNTKADKGNDTLIKNSSSPTEKKMWTKQQTGMRYDGAQAREAGAKDRVQIATDTYAKDMDNCNGDPYCARQVTLDYRNSLMKELPNLTVQKGGPVTAATLDTGASATFLNTLNQVNDALGGKKITIPAGAQAGGQTTSRGAPGYTLIDAASGVSPDNPSGVMATLGNGFNDDMGKLDRGGWISTVQAPPNKDGSPRTNADGSPIWVTVVHDPKEQPPQGAVPVPATTLMTDPTRTTDPGVLGGGGPVTKSPTVWVTPLPPQLSVVGPDGVTIDQSNKGSVNVVRQVNGAPAEAPWSELDGVPGPDGHPRTLYRVQNTDPATRATNPYVYLDKPPVVATTQMTSNGIPIVHATMGTDPKSGAPVANVDVGQYVQSAQAASKPMASGNLPLGSFYTPGGTTAALAIRDAYAAGTTKDGVTPAQKVQKIMDTYGAATEHLSPNDPMRVAAAHDTNQLTQTIGLYAKGGIGQVTDDNYNALNTRTPAQNLMAGGLQARGLGNVSSDEMDRRTQLMTGLNAIDAGLKAKQDSMTSDWTKIGQGVNYAAPSYLSDIQSQRDQLAQQRANILNPTISVSQIKIPGMSQMFQPPQANAPFSAFGMPINPQFQYAPPVTPAVAKPITTPGGLTPHKTLNPGDGTTSSTGGPHGPVTSDPVTPTVTPAGSPVVNPITGRVTGVTPVTVNTPSNPTNPVNKPGQMNPF